MKYAKPSLNALQMRKMRDVENICSNSDGMANCPCGSNVRIRHLKQHFKTLKHQEWMK